MSSYIPERDDYLNWEEDWNKIPEWDDGTHTKIKREGFFDTKIWMNAAGQIHRSDDKPAKINDHTIQWWKYGQHYREKDKPSNITIDGRKTWFNKQGEMHRDNDKPAYVYQNFDWKEWYINGTRYFPIESITKSIFSNLDYAEYFLWNLLQDDMPKKDFNDIFDFEFQKQLLNKNPSMISLIPKELLIPEYEGLGILGDLGL